MLWRGHFNATGEEKSVNLSINGGRGAKYPASSGLLGNSCCVIIGFAASVWLNDVFLNTSFGK